MEDKRFTQIKSDPKFRRIPKSERKVKIDKRFQSMFSSKQFKVKYTTDKRGRPVNHTSSEDLKRYYELSSSESESSSSDTEIEPTAPLIPKPAKAEQRLLDPAIKAKLQNLSVDYARGESNLLSESSSDDESEDEVSETDDIDHKWGELDADATNTDEATNRLAACNMDWDRIRAVDLMVLFNSFLPPGGAIKSVAIYPSEFGKLRIVEEETKGPIELIDKQENQDGADYHMERLRQYQLNRLKYYYAVIEFDSSNSAEKIYAECDGMEYESSATKIDLRFVPEEMTFDDEVKERCDALPEVNKYAPRFFTTTALQQIKVDLTWDETDQNRLEITEKLNSGKFDEISAENLKSYMAGSSGESEAEVEEGDSSGSDEDLSGKDKIGRYKALLQDIEDKEAAKKSKEVEMEVSWGIDLKEKSAALVKMKKDKQEKEDKTPFQQYLDKRKEKRKEKRGRKKGGNDSDSDVPSDVDLNDPYFAEEFSSAEFKQTNSKNKNKNKNKLKKNENDDKSDKQKQAELDLLIDDDETNEKHFSLKKIQERESLEAGGKKKKRKNKKEVESGDGFEVDVADERFAALFTSHHYNIDPTDSHYKKTKAMDRLVGEKLKRRNEEGESVEASVKKPKKEGSKRDPELSLLVKSVKRKAQAMKYK